MSEDIEYEEYNELAGLGASAGLLWLFGSGCLVPHKWLRKSQLKKKYEGIDLTMEQMEWLEEFAAEELRRNGDE